MVPAARVGHMQIWVDPTGQKPNTLNPYLVKQTLQGLQPLRPLECTEDFVPYLSVFRLRMLVNPQ